MQQYQIHYLHIRREIKNGTRYIPSETKHNPLCSYIVFVSKFFFFNLSFLINHYTDCQFQYSQLKLDIILNYQIVTPEGVDGVLQV